MSKLLIKNGRVIDPANKIDKIRDILIEDGRVSDNSDSTGAEVIDATGLWITPGLIDMHVHLRDPGLTHKETIATGAAAAAAGGITTVLAMPNTNPAIDCASVVNYVHQAAHEAGASEVLVAGTLSHAREGKNISDMAGMVRAGAVAFTDDGSEVENARVLHAAMKEAARLDKPVLCHAEEPSLVEGGSMNASPLAEKLGLGGRSSIAELIAVERDLILAEDANCRVHIQHVSSPKSILAIKRAVARGVAATCEVTPQHLLLTEDLVATFDANAKLNPPFRSAEEKDGLVAALNTDIDIIATDHAPHTIEDKGFEFGKAAPGVIGLETSLGLMLTEFVGKGLITPSRMVELMSLTPARTLLLKDRGHLGAGVRGNVTIIDPNLEWHVEPAEFKSKGRNTPFTGRALKGAALITIVEGRIVFDAR